MTIGLTGVKIVGEFLSSSYQRVSHVYMDSRCQGMERKGIETLASKKGVFLKRVGKEETALKYGGKKVKNGIVATIPGFSYFDIEEITSPGENEKNAVLMLDRIQDPHNLGAIARSAYCFGVAGVVLQEKGSSQVTDGAILSSSGALAHIRVARVVNLSRAIDHFKKAGYWVYGATPHGGTGVGKIDFAGRVLLLIGSEGGGIRKKLLEKCDMRVSVPTDSSFDSLNVSVAVGIILHTMRNEG